MKFKLISSCALLFCTTLLSSNAALADWPADQPVKMVVAFPPGGPADTLARLLSKELEERTGGTYIVENRPGAGATIGTDYVSRAKADGYTLLLTSAVAQAVNPGLLDINYDPVEDFEHISLMARGPVALLANAKAPYKTVDDLKEAAKDNPIHFGAATGSVGHLTGEMVREQVGFDLAHIPYKGTGPAMADVLGGHIELVSDVLTAHAELIKDGRVNVVAVAAEDRQPIIPDVPTFKELGYDLVAYSWFGLVAPAGIPEEVAVSLNQAVTEILQTPEFSQRIQDWGMETTPEVGGDAYKDFTRDEVNKWAEVIDSANITVQ